MTFILPKVAFFGFIYMNIYYKNTDCKLKLLNFDFNKLNPLHYMLCFVYVYPFPGLFYAYADRMKMARVQIFRLAGVILKGHRDFFLFLS